MAAFRLDPVLLEAVKACTSNVTGAIEEGMRLWLARERRKAAKADPLARHLAPPTAHELAARKEAP
jgi:hypothetical protein